MKNIFKNKDKIKISLGDKKKKTFLAISFVLITISLISCFVVYKFTSDIFTSLIVAIAFLLLAGSSYSYYLLTSKEKAVNDPEALVKIDYLNRMVGYLLSNESFLSSHKKVSNEIQNSIFKDSITLKPKKKNQVTYSVKLGTDDLSLSSSDAFLENLINSGLNSTKLNNDDFFKGEKDYKKKISLPKKSQKFQLYLGDITFSIYVVFVIFSIYKMMVK